MTSPPDSRQTAKICPFRTPPRSSSHRCSLALGANSPHSSLRVSRHLRTLSFSGSQLSPVLPASCALIRKKPGGTTPAWSEGLACRSFSEGGLSPLFPLLKQKRGEEVCLAKSLFCGLACLGRSLERSPKNVGAPTFSIFPLISRTLLALSAAEGSQLATCPPRKAAAKQERTAGRSACTTGHRPLLFAPLSVTSRQYCAPIAHPRSRTEPIRIPASCGNPPYLAGMSPLTRRCPDAHD